MDSSVDCMDNIVKMYREKNDKNEMKKEAEIKVNDLDSGSSEETFIELQSNQPVQLVHNPLLPKRPVTVREMILEKNSRIERKVKGRLGKNQHSS